MAPSRACLVTLGALPGSSLCKWRPRWAAVLSVLPPVGGLGSSFLGLDGVWAAPCGRRGGRGAGLWWRTQWAGGRGGVQDQVPSCASVGRLWYWVWFNKCWQVWGAGQQGEGLPSGSRVGPVDTPAPGANPGEQGSPNPWTNSEDPGSQRRKVSGWR